MNYKKLMTTLTLLVTVSPILSSQFEVLAHAQKNDWIYVEDICQAHDKKSNAGANTNGVTLDGDWLTEGSPKYEIVKKMFEFLTKEKGLSGASASSVIGAIKSEANFDQDRAETAYFTKPYRNIYFGMDSKEAPEGAGASVPSSEDKSRPDYFGGGLWQTTPYTKYTNSRFWKARPNSQGWSAENQLDFLFADELENRAMEPYMRSTDSSYGAAHYGYQPVFTKLEEFYSTDDPEKGALAFTVGYLRPGKSAAKIPQRQADAKAANAVFNKDNIPADPSKWKFGSNNGLLLNATQSSSEKEKEKACKGEGSSATGLQVQGSGSHGLSISSPRIFKRNQLPDSLKQYAINPEPIGLIFHGEGWDVNSGFLDQCTSLTAALANHLWVKDGQGPVQRMGNGNEVARNWANKFGGSTSNVPTNGAIFSSTGPVSHPVYGHTGIVSHVFENGDILVIEQNISGYSGEGNGESKSWNYRVVDAESVKRDFEFYDPSVAGYSLNPQTTSMK